MGGREALAVEAAKLQPRAQDVSRKRGQALGQEIQPLSRGSERAFGNFQEKFLRKLRPCAFGGAVASMRESRRIEAIALRFLQKCGKVPLSAHLMREKQVLFFEHKIGMTCEELCDLFLIFTRLERAGGIDERAAACKHFSGVVENFPLTGNTAFHVLLAPLRDRARVLAEHPLARAGSIDEDLVKVCGKFFDKRRRIRADDGAVFHAQPLDVLREDPGAVIDVLVCNQYALPPHSGGELSGLSARRGAQIEHPFARFCVQERRGAHGGRLLHIEQPRMVRGRVSEFFRRRIKSALRPRDGLVREGREVFERLRRTFQKVGAHAPDGRGVITTQKGGVRRAQPFLHSC